MEIVVIENNIVVNRFSYKTDALNVSAYSGFKAMETRTTGIYLYDSAGFIVSDEVIRNIVKETLIPELMQRLKTLADNQNYDLLHFNAEKLVRYSALL